LLVAEAGLVQVACTELEVEQVTLRQVVEIREQVHPYKLPLALEDTSHE
jgi:hypothetical protein